MPKSGIITPETSPEIHVQGVGYLLTYCLGHEIINGEEHCDGDYDNYGPNHNDS